MVNEVFEKIGKTEDCRILEWDAIQSIDFVRSYQNVIEVKTEISFQSGVKEVVLFVAIL